MNTPWILSPSTLGQIIAAWSGGILVRTDGREELDFLAWPRLEAGQLTGQLRLFETRDQALRAQADRQRPPPA